MQKIVKSILFAEFLELFAVIATGLLLLLFWASHTFASGGPTFRHGTIAVKGMVMGDHGKPIWTEYNNEGEVVREIGEASGDPLEGARVMAAVTYRAFVDAFRQIETAHRPNYEILYRSSYESRTFAGPTGNIIYQPRLKSGTQSVVVRKPLFDSVDMVLHESPLDLNRLEDLSVDKRAVLLNREGQVLEQSSLNIGYLVAYYTPQGASGNVDPAGQRSLWGYRPGDKLWGPIGGATMRAFGGHYPSVSDTDGDYLAYYIIPPCPGFSFQFPHHVWAEMRYQHFSPKQKDQGSYYEWRPAFDYCMGFSEGFFPTTLVGLVTKSVLIGIEASRVQPMYRIDFPVIASILTGEGSLQNQTRAGVAIDGSLVGIIPQGGTNYAFTAPAFTPLARDNLDIDGDGNPDQASLNAGGGVEVWLDSSNPATDPPDLTRLADVNPDISDQGLLKGISKTDLQNTDIYAYRVSNGQLINAQKGLTDNDISNNSNSLMNYRLLMRAPGFYGLNTWGFFDTFLSRTNLNPALAQRQADHLRAGEQIKVIMLNRATGYVGSAIGIYGQNTSAGIVSFSPPRINMHPPNLKIKAERRYEVESGLTAGEEREFIIGFEGSGLTSDTYVAITTEWLDWDGTPLPDDMPGLTGRLAKVVAPNTLGQASSQIANFEIEPGLHTQLIKLPTPLLDAAHYYIHVSGESPQGTPDFSAIGAGSGPLQYRPKHYAPFKVPVLDEKATLDRELARRQAIAAGQPDPGEVQPAHQWVYRPEMQFSLFDLEKMNLVKEDGTEYNLLIPAPSNKTHFAGSNYIYSLLEDDLQALASFGPDREIIFSIGGEEKTAYFGNDQRLEFHSPGHLSMLESEDYLAIRLYQNADDYNVLWEYAVPVVNIDIARLSGDVVEQNIEASEGSITKSIRPGIDTNPDAWHLQLQNLKIFPVTAKNNYIVKFEKVLPTNSPGDLKIFHDGTEVNFSGNLSDRIMDLDGSWTIQVDKAGVVDLALVCFDSSNRRVGQDRVRVVGIIVPPKSGKIFLAGNNDEFDLTAEQTGFELFEGFDTIEDGVNSVGGENNANIVIGRGIYNENELNLPTNSLMVGLAGEFEAAPPYTFKFQDLPVIGPSSINRVIKIDQNESNVIAALHIKDGQTNESGAGLLINKSEEVKVNYSIFENNIANEGGGGAAIIEPGAGIKIENCRFIKNESNGDDGGGGALVKAEPVTIGSGNTNSVSFANCLFGGRSDDANIANDSNAETFASVSEESPDTGDISYEGSGSVQGRNGGGGIAVIDAVAEVVDTEISYNIAVNGGYGGGCAVSTEANLIKQTGKLKLIRTVVKNNQAQGGGGIGILPKGRDKFGNGFQVFGILLNSGAECEIIESNIENNTLSTGTSGVLAGGAGVLIAGDYSKFIAIDSTIQNNTIPTAPGGDDYNRNGDGGGIAILDYAVANLSDARIVNNTVNADDGGGINVVLSELYMTNGVISGNQTTRNAYAIRGGGIHLNSASLMKLNGTRITSNSARQDGGGINIRNSEAEINNVTISNNTATGDMGGGIKLLKFSASNENWAYQYVLIAGPHPAGTLDVINSTVEENTAGGAGGGAIVFKERAGIWSNPILTIDGSTFRANNGHTNGGGVAAGTYSADGIMLTRKSKCYVINNSVIKEHAGAAIAADDLTSMNNGVDLLSVDNATFDDNGIAILSNDTIDSLTVRNSEFQQSTICHVELNHFQDTSTDILFERNNFNAAAGTRIAFRVDRSKDPGLLSDRIDVHFNNISGFLDSAVPPQKFGILVMAPDADEDLDFSNNWWGHTSGPTHGTSGPLGSRITDGVNFTPHSTGPH